MNGAVNNGQLHDFPSVRKVPTEVKGPLQNPDDPDTMIPGIPNRFCQDQDPGNDDKDPPYLKRRDAPC